MGHNITENTKGNPASQIDEKYFGHREMLWHQMMTGTPKKSVQVKIQVDVGSWESVFRNQSIMSLSWRPHLLYLQEVKFLHI